MESIGKFLKPRVSSKKGANSERAELIGKFADTLNKDRDGKKYKKLSYAAVGYILAHIKTNQDLNYFFRVCTDSKSFSKKFWYELSLRKHGQI